MASNTVQQGKAAWVRLKKGSRSWTDWKDVGQALLEGRAIAMRNAGADRPAGKGYTQALSSWLTDNQFRKLPPVDRTALFIVMENLPAIEAWRATLPEARRLRMNGPAAVLGAMRKAGVAGTVLESPPLPVITPL